MNKNNLKIHLVQVLGLLAHGGAEHLVVDLCEKIDKKKFKVTLIVLGEYEKCEPSLIERLQASSVNIIFLNKPIGKEKIKILIKLYKTFKRIKPDIIHTHLEINSIYCAILSFIIKLPVFVQTIHNTKLYYPILTRLFNKRFKKLIAISDEVYDLILNQIKSDKQRIITIYNGVDTNKFSPFGPLSNEILSHYIEEKILKLVVIGRLTKQKGHSLLINALKMLEDKINFVLFIIGEGELKEDLIKLAKELNLEKRIKFLGNQNDIPAILRTCDMYLLPSLWEGLSISLLEAISTGIPIVATDVGSNKKVLENSKTTYKIIEPNNIKEISNGIFQLYKEIQYKDEIRKTNRNKEFNYLGEKYTLSNFVKSHKELYMELYLNNIN